MALIIDENDPCTAAKTLRSVYLQLVAGVQTQTVRFRAGETGVEREVSFHKAQPDKLLHIIRDFEDHCARRNGDRPRRFALRAGGA